MHIHMYVYTTLTSMSAQWTSVKYLWHLLPGHLHGQTLNVLPANSQQLLSLYMNM